MRSAIREIHKREGYPAGKILGSRRTEDDWLTKIIENNKKMYAFHSRINQIKKFVEFHTRIMKIIGI